MLKKIPLRLRLTLISVLLLLICCLGLTMILNISANNMADVIEAAPLMPATSIDSGSMDESTAVPLVPSIASQQARVVFLNQSYIYMLIIVLSGGFLTYFITGKALSPLHELSHQIRNRTVNNLSETLPVPESHDEVASLTASFNEMTRKLNEAFSMQKRFSQSAAHELRTPLTVMKTKVDVFKKKAVHSPEEYDKLIDMITIHTDRLSDLVKDLLDLTNMDMLECCQRIAVKPMLTNVLNELSELAAEKGVTLSLEGDACEVLGNESLLNRAFCNLIENAVKYNKQNGSVSVRVKCTQANVEITIIDTGIGIPVEQRDLIFEPFYRVDKSRSRQIGGAGLGLSMVKSIVNKLGGQIIITDNPDGGSIFTVII